MPITAWGFIYYKSLEIDIYSDVPIQFMLHFMYTFYAYIFAQLFCIALKRTFYDWICAMQYHYNFVGVEVKK